MKRLEVRIEPKPRTTPDPQPIVVKDKPGRHHFALRRKGFYVCLNCSHWQVFMWTDPLTGGDTAPQCWTCGSKDVVHSSKRPIEGPKDPIKKLGIRAMRRLIDNVNP